MIRKKFSQLLVLISALCAATCAAAPDQRHSADLMDKGFSTADEVEFYFIFVTDAPDYSVEEMRRNASVKVTRRCGRNCSSFMKDVLANFQGARSRECLKGDQNVLIEVKGRPPIVYSHGGRHISYLGHCYLNQRSINDVIQSEEFIF